MSLFFISSVSLCLCLIWAWPLHGLPKTVLTRDIGGRLIDGIPASEGQFPWQVAIKTTSATFHYMCGGAIINEEWILTSGQCVYGIITADIVAGSTNLSSPDSTTIAAVESIVHENYNSQYYTNDVGLLRLKTPLIFNDYIKPIALSEQEVPPNVTVTISGWGLTSDSYPDPPGDSLNYAEVRTYDAEKCGQTYPHTYSSRVVCTVDGGGCWGDSGDAVVLNASTDPLHVGILSFWSGFGCGRYPTVSTKTAYYRDWIRNHTGV
jgi:secreted trypsin-like serine protease